jgi:hypothetical protein
MRANLGLPAREAVWLRQMVFRQWQEQQEEQQRIEADHTHCSLLFSSPIVQI